MLVEEVLIREIYANRQAGTNKKEKRKERKNRENSKEEEKEGEVDKYKDR